MVRHDVDDQAQTVRPGGRRQRAQPALAAELGPYHRVVDHVVAVGGARHRLQDGGEMQMGHAQRGELRHRPLGGGEREVRLEL